MGNKPKQNRPSEVIYQVYPASFYDADGDGHGDLKGITQKLDYVKSLGVDAIWISPFFLSPAGPAGDGGYAVSNYREIAPQFGKNKTPEELMHDFEELLEEAHKRGLRIYTDFVLCHTSDEHEWFEKSRNKEAGYEDRYVWRDAKYEQGQPHTPDNRRPPNNWKSCFTNKSAWEWDDKRGQYYLHHFNTSQPALNLNDEKTQDAILGEMKFWLDKGVDGLRLDALPFANHDPEFRDNRWRDGIKWPNDESQERWDMQYFDRSMCQPQTVELVKKIRGLLDSYPTKKTALGEVIAGRHGGTGSPEVAAEYIDAKTGLDTCYTESLIRFWEYPSAAKLRDMLRESLRYSSDGGFCTNASNHDFPRAVTRMTQKAPEEMRSSIVRQLMSMYMSLPGSICMYQGEELGLPQARIPEDIPHHRKKDLVDPRCRDGARTPMPWQAKEKNAGFSPSDDPYLPIAGSHYARAVDIQEHEPNSMLEFTRTLIEERKNNPALNRGVTTVLDTDKKDPDIFAFVRRTEDQTVLLAYNMSGHAKTFKPADYLDAKTLEELDIPAWSDVRVHAYGYSQHGVVIPPHKRAETPMLAEEPSAEMGTEPATASLKGRRIFAADMLIADNLIPDAVAPKVIAEHAMVPDQKRMIDRAEHDKLMAATPAHEITFGGATAITLWTLKKLLGDEVNINYMGLAADDAHGRIVRDALKKAGINLLTETWPDGIQQENSVSHVVKHPSGQNSVFTYPGTEAEALKKRLAQDPELLKRSIKDSDIVYLPGGLTEKFGQTFIDELLTLRWRYKKELVMSLPTHANFGPSDNQTFKRLVASANVVVGNDVEFSRLYDMKTERPVTDEQLERITGEIRKAFRSNVLENEGRPCPEGQVALITRGDKPALLVIADKQGDRVLKIPAAQITKKNNILGAGDAVAAGFLAGYIKGLDHEQSAKLAMAVAAEKIEQQSPNPHLDDPQKSLEKVFLRKSLSRLAAAYHAGGEGGSLSVAVRG